MQLLSHYYESYLWLWKEFVSSKRYFGDCVADKNLKSRIRTVIKKFKLEYDIIGIYFTDEDNILIEYLIFNECYPSILDGYGGYIE